MSIPEAFASFQEPLVYAFDTQAQAHDVEVKIKNAKTNEVIGRKMLYGVTAAEVDKSINQSAVEWAIEQNKILYALTACILGPVVEEVIYRGIIFNALAGEKNNTKRNVIAVILTALIFAIMHVTFVGFTFYDLLANLPVFMIGLTVTLLYLKTGNILCPILVHMVINTISVIAQSVM
jgi:membrane protease YdiL (CAAX protease family)